MDLRTLFRGLFFSSFLDISVVMDGNAGALHVFFNPSLTRTRHTKHLTFFLMLIVYTLKIWLLEYLLHNYMHLVQDKIQSDHKLLQIILYTYTVV